MSNQQGRLISELLNRYFGEIVQKIGYDLFTNGSKPLGIIVRSTGLTRTQVVESLRTLLKFDLASFEPSSNEVTAEYKLMHDNVLLLMRYPRYLLQMKSKYGSEAELIVEELLQNGITSATRLLVTVATKYKDDKEKNITILSLKDTFTSLATAGYIQQAAVASSSDVPTLEAVATIVPEFEARTLLVAMETGQYSDNIYWKVNYERFHQDFRDEIMVQAMTRRIDENAGDLMRQLLSQMYLLGSPAAATSNPIPTVDLKQCCRRTPYEPFLDQYLRVLEECSSGIVSRVGDAGGGQWAVSAGRAAREAAAALLEHVVTERRGHKAARIFRLIRTKKYIEEEDIQKIAMLPNKECKELTYKLLEEHFISVQPMRKAASAGGLVKAIYLYYVNMFEVARTAQQMCFRSARNVLSRAAAERAAHARLRDKQRRVRSIVHGMRARQEPQENIDDVEETITPPERAMLAAVERRLKQLSAAEIELDKSLFILQWYFMFNER